MKFVIIDPAVRLYQRVNVGDIEDAYAMVGLKPGTLDHSVLMPLCDGGGIGLVAYDFAFFVPPLEQSYFALNGKLLAGPAVLYQYDEPGHTVDLGDTVIVTRWFNSAAQVDYLIKAGVLERPELRVNGELIWSWPEPPPPDIADSVAENKPRGDANR
jgi:hypothetical protein